MLTFKTAKKMFPFQNCHYASNFFIGLPTANYRNMMILRTRISQEFANSDVKKAKEDSGLGINTIDVNTSFNKKVRHSQSYGTINTFNNGKINYHYQSLNSDLTEPPVNNKNIDAEKQKSKSRNSKPIQNSSQNSIITKLKNFKESDDGKTHINQYPDYVSNFLKRRSDKDKQNNRTKLKFHNARNTTNLPPIKPNNASMDFILNDKKKIFNELEKLEKEKEEIAKRIIIYDSILTNSIGNPIEMLYNKPPQSPDLTLMNKSADQKLDEPIRKQEPIIRKFKEKLYPKIDFPSSVLIYITISNKTW